ncbi:rod shape-determining protein RodA [Candidatus Wolfebacteria bacterium]|nr:rod shape-determining protein RodA [Candidatus Wolfebacteria bacterium]
MHKKYILEKINKTLGVRLGAGLDWKLNFAVLFLVAIGLISLFGARIDLFWKQLMWLGFGLILIFLIVKFDWRSFINHKWAIFGIYWLSVFLLILTLILAPKIRGTRAWIPIGPFQFQTSVFAALALIIILANFFKKEHKSIARISKILKSFVYFAIPSGLVALQPDFGSVLLLFFIWFGFILVSGIPWRHLLVAVLIFAVLGVAMWQVVLKEYQKDRILGLFFPNRDVLGINYNVVQSKIAIGSAGFFGKGFKQGTQVQLGFLPEAQTDFIFAAVIEEWGLFSGFLMIIAFITIILRIVFIGLDEKNNFNRFICLGTAIYFCANFIFNTGSNIGLLPVIGVPFPFLSYGGSHIMAEFVLIGIVQSIKIRKI